MRNLFQTRYYRAQDTSFLVELEVEIFGIEISLA